MTVLASSSAQNTWNSAQSLKDRLIEMRRWLHQNAELSFAEWKTTAYITGIMKELNYRVQELPSGSGLIAEIGTGEKIIGIRADIDALPIEEINQSDYRSANSGVMHACGHDAHTACALGAAAIIADLVNKKVLPGRVRFLFQPAEETVNSDGLSGASLMMEAGALNDLSALIALHVFPGIPCGVVGFRPGIFLAACDAFDITIHGKGGHGAFPESTIDAVVIASQVVQTLQSVISRRKSAVQPAVLTVGGIRSNTYRSNIVAGEVEMTGTVRYFAPELSGFFQSEIEKTCQIAASLGGNFHLSYKQETPALENNSEITAIVRAVAESLLSKSQVLDLPVQLGADDFSFYTANVPACYFVLGAGIPGCSKEIHTADFDINEEALIIGTAIFAESALRLLSEPTVKPLKTNPLRVD